MAPKARKKTGTAFTLRMALDEFYGSSKYKCDGITATANDVVQIANEANRKLEMAKTESLFRDKSEACLQSMRFFADVLDEDSIPPVVKPSALVWGCLKYLLKLTIYLEKLAEMFYDIGDFCNPELQQNSTSILNAISVRRKVPPLFIRVIICCARAMEAINKKREIMRPLIWKRMIKPFDFSYATSLSIFRRHREELALLIQRVHSPSECPAHFLRGVDLEQHLAGAHKHVQTQKRGLRQREPCLVDVEREKVMLAIERKLETPMW